MNTSSGLKLSTKLTLITAILITLSVIIAVFVTFYFGNQIADESIDKKLNSSHLIQDEFKQQKLKQLELVSLVVASDPAFVAYVAQTIFDLENDANADIASIADLLLERKQQYGFDVAIIASVDGQQIARSDQAMSAPRNLNDIKLMQEAMDALLPVSGYWSDSQNYYQAAVVPLSRGRNLIGFLITGLIIDDQLANDIAKLSGTEVMVLDQHQGQLVSLGSTMDLNMSDSMILALSQLSNVDNNSTLNVNQQQLFISSESLAKLGDHHLLILNAVSVDQTLAPFYKTRNILIISGVAAIILASLLARFFVNQFLSPLSQMSSATRQVSYGNYTAKFPESVGRDLDDLSGSINQLVQNLRGRDALAGHMIELSKKSTYAKDKAHKPTKIIIEPGKIINNRYEIIENIGTGGMGAVFQAYDQELEEVVALKVLKAKNTNTSDIAQFKDEIKVARRISHPNVVRIHDFGQLADNVFISMEFVQGYTLELLLKYARKLRPQAAKHAAIHICEGLKAAHEVGVVHKDLKPANIIVELDTSIKLMDFGIASIDDVISSQRSNKLVGGTAAYMAPEQATGNGADERSDIYALGILLMEMFIGQRPFYATSDQDLMLKHVSEAPLPISIQWADAPKTLEQLIQKCLAKEPNSRPQNIQEVLSELKTIKFKV
ncbi:MAG: protein kinase [Marinicella sp.]|nr:protein kinase [Xanthomonadales bacterium]